MSNFRMYNVFLKTENLVVVTTGDIASEEKQDLLGAEEIRRAIVNEFFKSVQLRKK